MLGFSSHNVEQLCGGRREPVDYVAIGPIFGHGSKRESRPGGRGRRVRRCRALVEKPLVAIGGITRENALDVLRAGADSVAVIAGLLPDDPHGSLAAGTDGRMATTREEPSNRPRQGPRTGRRHHAGDGLDDRLRRLHRGRGYLAPGAIARPDDHDLGRHRGAHPDRGAQLRRTGRRHAARRRAVRLPARSVRPAVRIPLRLDAVPGDPDRHHRRRGGGVRQISPASSFPGSPPRTTCSAAASVGLTTQQLLAIADARPPDAGSNTRGIRTGAIVQNVFTFAKIARAAGTGRSRASWSGRNPAAVAAQLHGFLAQRRAGASTPSGWWAWPWWARCSPPTPGTTSRSPPARCAIRGATCRSRWRSAWRIGVGALHRLQLRLPERADRSKPSSTPRRIAWRRRGRRRMFGPVAVQIMAAAIMISTFGCVNGLILSGARVYYAMAQDGLFFRRPARSIRRRHTPVFSLGSAMRLGLPADPERAATTICSTMLSSRCCSSTF